MQKLSPDGKALQSPEEDRPGEPVTGDMRDGERESFTSRSGPEGLCVSLTAEQLHPNNRHVRDIVPQQLRYCATGGSHARSAERSGLSVGR